MYQRSERLGIRMTSAGIAIVALGERNRVIRYVGTWHSRVVTRRLSDDDQWGLIKLPPSWHMSAALPFSIRAVQFSICFGPRGPEQCQRWRLKYRKVSEEVDELLS